MAYIIENSVPAMHAESQLFSVPVTYTDRWRTETERINPTTILTDDGTSGDINFFIPPSSNGLLDLANVTLEVELAIKVKTKDGPWNFIGDGDLVAPVNNILHSLFQSVKLTVGNRLISDANCNYGYRAYMEALLFHSRDNARSILGNAGFRVDTPGQQNAHDQNDSAKWRRSLFSTGDYVQLSGKLACDLFQQDKPLMTGVPLSIRLVAQSRKEYYLQVWDAAPDKEFKVVIRNPRIAIRRFIPAPDYLIKVTEELQRQTIKYAVERTIMRTTDIVRGVQSTIVSNLHIGALPKVVFIGFVASEDYQGRIKNSPYNFQHFNISQLSVEVDGQSFPTKPYFTNFAKHQSLEAYDGLLNTLGMRYEPNGQCNFDRDGFEMGNTIFGFDLTPGSTGRGPMTLIKQGTLSVSISFAQPLQEVVMMVTMLVYDNLIEINEQRQIVADFTS